MGAEEIFAAVLNIIHPNLSIHHGSVNMNTRPLKYDKAYEPNFPLFDFRPLPERHSIIPVRNQKSSFVVILPRTSAKNARLSS